MNPHRGGTSATVAWAKTTKFRVERVSPAAGKAIMLVLADYADQSWSCWLGQQAIAEMADIGERTVRRFLAGAQEAGWLCVVSRTRKEAKGQGRGRGADRLYLHVDGDRSACPQCIDLPEDLAGNSEGLTGHPGHDLPATQGQKPRATPLIPEPAKEPAKPPALSAPKKPKVTDLDPVKRSAHTLTVRAFELSPKPVLRSNGDPFAAVMAIFERQLRAGTSVNAIRTALDGGFMKVWTGPGLQTALAQSEPKRAGPSRRDQQAEAIPEIVDAMRGFAGFDDGRKALNEG